MGSHISNTDSRGLPVDHDGVALEYGVGDGLGVPFAVSSSVFKELMREESISVDLQHCESSPVEDNGLPSVYAEDRGAVGCLGLEIGTVRPSSLGHIPIAVSDVDSEPEEELPFTEDEIAAMERYTVNPVARAAFVINKNEREELFALRRKLMEIDTALKKKGLSMVDLEKEELLSEARSNSGLSSRFIQGRDEYGLPIFSNSAGTSDASKVFVDLSERNKNCIGGEPSRTIEGKSSENLERVKASVLDGQGTKLEDAKGAAGSTIVSPPDEVLMKGNEKLKFCIVGSLTKGVLSYSRICKFAHGAWDKYGLVHVAQKDNRTFIFKFDSEESMHNALARGTWYIDKQPMLVNAWGAKVGSVKTIPLWVKFEKVPDCYWTVEGLGSLSSAIGPPIGADALTSQLEILPFAKMCVQYTIGNALPSLLQALDLDPSSGEKSVVDVVVSYPNKPLVCTACKTLGHLVGACPMAIRKWVRKEKPELETPLPAVASPGPNPADPSIEDPPIGQPKDCSALDSEEGTWQTVKKKKGHSPAPLADSPSPSPLNTFKNLRKIDEVEGKKFLGKQLSPNLSKSQLKRLKRTKGSSSPPFH
ncbi:hypothetical protein POM88_054286 [Heracleum sosnowskyi]|uniref:DUF4283 domain-containing protein n=1 Tax=Heracleum sosnowskyi TaxID=360622 RepID=A0AAD8GN09_9APIA|nr:hypothetical protein POM88_054286 [Heracleum sosnowskyi]